MRQVVSSKWPHHLLELDVALHTGLRRSEMYGLDWADVDLGRRFVRVRRGKNGECRYARLNAVALRAFTKLQESGDEAGPVFRGRSGDALKSARHWFEDALKEAGIEDFRWHDLRHTFASRLAMAGASIRAIQEALGHKSIAMTVRYSHLSPDFIQDAVDRLAPQQQEELAENQTDTRTDTSELEAMETGSTLVH